MVVNFRVMEVVSVIQLGQTRRSDIASIVGMKTILENTAAAVVAFETKKSILTSKLKLTNCLENCQKIFLIY